MFLTRLCKVLDQHKIPYAIVGGYAVAFHGCVRGTVDIDLVTKLDGDLLQQLEKALASLNLRSRLPITSEDIFHFRKEYIQNRNLVAWNFFNEANPLESVDVLITHDVGEFRIIKKKIENHIVKIVALEDLIKMKQASGRPQDLEDVKALEKKYESSKTNVS